MTVNTAPALAADQALGQITKMLTQVRLLLLRTHGFEPHRVGEYLHPQTRRHVRMSYAGGEWVVYRGVLPRVGAGESGGRAITNLGTRVDGECRLDRRLYNGSRSLPHPDQLAAWCAGPPQDAPE